jgi:hypothetical protein
MQFSNPGLLVAVFGSISLACPVVLSGQVLQQRPQGVAPAPTNTLRPQVPQSLELPAGTTLQVEVNHNFPMKAGEVVEASLVYPLYLDGKLVIPANTSIRGTVTSLQPDRKTRWHARLRGDFTPFHHAEVRFDQLLLPGGMVPLHSNGATTGAPVIRLTAPGAAPHQSLIARQWARAKNSARGRIAFFTDPGLGDRSLQILYHQLPYHPERIAAHTAWTFELNSALLLPDEDLASDPPPPPAVPGKPDIWSVHALLSAEVTSASAKPGDPVQALVVEPVFDKNGELVVPQGSTLVGKVTTAKSARSLGRNGKLRFTFQQIRFPAANGQSSQDREVEGALAGATTQSLQSLSMDAEGTVTPKNKSSVIAPLLLTMLAGRALDNDGNFTAQAGVASNGFGFVGRIVGVAAGDRNLAAGIGYYAAALSLYENFLTPGHDVDFPKDTRIEIETTPLRAPVLKLEGQ